MRHKPIKNKLFSENRKRLTTLLAPKSLAVINANDLLPVNADATLVMHPNSDLFFLSGIEQEESLLLIFPDAAEEKTREILFLREPNEHLKIWEGYKHTKEDARKISGIKNVQWLSEFPVTFRSLMLESDAAYLNSNEYKRANVEMETRDVRFIRQCQQDYPLHDFRRLAPLLHQLRVTKTDLELELLKEAIDITTKGFNRMLRFVKPRFNKTQHAVESLRGDVNGLFEQFQLEIGFCDPQLMQQRREPTKVVQWVILLALADEADVACFHLDVGAFVLIAVQVGCIGLQHERAKRHREFGKPLDIFDARNLTRIFFRVFISLPNFQVFVGFSQEKNLPGLLLGGIRENQK